MQKLKARAREKIVQHLQWSQRDAVRHRREARRVDARERIDQSVQLDRVSRVCISTIQRLYSMLRSLLFWIETLMPQGQFTRGDRLRVACIPAANSCSFSEIDISVYATDGFCGTLQTP